MGRRFFLSSLWIAGLVAWPGALALAADGEGVNLEPVIQELRAENPELSESEVRELTGLAVQDLRGGEGAARDLAGGATTEQAGIVVMGPGNLGAPELGGGPGSEVTPEQQQERMEYGRFLADEMGYTNEQIREEMNKRYSPEQGPHLEGEGYNKEKQLPQDPREIQYPWEGPEQTYPGERGDTRLRELYQEGRPVGEALQQHERGEFGGERPTQEQIERYRELGGHEIDRPAVERGTFEREQVTHEPVERPMAEQPTRETERPTHERPEGMPGY